MSQRTTLSTKYSKQVKSIGPETRPILQPIPKYHPPFILFLVRSRKTSRLPSPNTPNSAPQNLPPTNSESEHQRFTKKIGRKKEEKTKRNCIIISTTNHPRMPARDNRTHKCRFDLSHTDVSPHRRRPRPHRRGALQHHRCRH